MDARLITQVVDRLRSDKDFDFKSKQPHKLGGGKCPDCGEPEAYLFTEKPFLIHCPRTKCQSGGSTHIKTLPNYEHFFTNFSENYPATVEDPDATARVYLKYGRGFDGDVVKGLYSQGSAPIYKGRGKDSKLLKYGATVKFDLWEGFTWERFIDESDVRLNGGKKNHITKDAKFAGKGWVPPGQTYEEETFVFITEGILKSIALMHLEASFNLETIAAISTSNFPRDIIEEHKGKGVIWVLAYDGDYAGIKASKKYIKELEAMGEQFLIALPPQDKDWDDLLKEGRLNEDAIKDAFYRGAKLTAETHKDKLFWMFAKAPSAETFRFDFNDALWRAKKNNEKAKESALNDYASNLKDCWALPRNGENDLEDSMNAVKNSFNFERIANCNPRFLFLERDAIFDDQFYHFNVKYCSGNPETKLMLEGSALQSPSSFSSVLLNKSSGGSFDGTVYDLKHLRDEWFDWGICEVRSFPFVGYDRDTGIYVFPFGAYYKNRFIKVNNSGYMETHKHKVKTGLKSVIMQHSEKFDKKIFKDFMMSFSYNGLMALAWWLGCLFAEQIRHHQKSWPFFELTGEQGAGKSTLIEFLWALFGRDNYEGFDPSSSSPAGRARYFVQVSNMPIVLIEGDREGESGGSKKGTFNFDELKKAYDGRPMRAVGVAKRGSDTEELPFRGGAVIAQNDTVDGSEALLARIVHAHCDRKHHSDESEKAIAAIQEAKNLGLSGFLHIVLSQADSLFEKYLSHFDQCREELKKALPEVQNRLVLNHSQVFAWGLCLKEIFGDEMKQEHIDGLKEHLINRAKDRQGRLKTDHPMVAKFWDVYDAENPFPERAGGVDQGACLFNHSTKPLSTIAINLVDFEKKASRRGVRDGLDFVALKKLLPNSQRYPFVGQKPVQSRLDKGSKYCWVFENKEREGEGGANT